MASGDVDAVAVFDRHPLNGRLTQKAGSSGCINDAGTSGCADGVALDGPRFVAVSPDGGSVYVSSANSDAVSVFTRDVRADDIDGNGTVDALTDGLLQLRYFFGFRGAILIGGAVDPVGCTPAAAIETYIQALLAP